MNRNNSQTRFMQARDTARNFAHSTTAKVGTAIATIGASFGAMAQATDPGGAILAEITSAKSTVGGILLALAAVLGLFLLWSMIKRAK